MFIFPARETFLERFAELKKEGVFKKAAASDKKKWSVVVHNQKKVSLNQKKVSLGKLWLT